MCRRDRVYGARVSLLVGFSVAVLSSIIGLTIGLFAGFVRWADGIIMRIIDGMMSIPPILLAIALMALTRGSIQNVIIAITVAEIPRVARLVRGVVLSLREQPYVEAAVANGCLLYTSGILKGLEDGPAVIMGSHIDTVGTGGRFDGALGVVAGVEVLAALRDAGLTPKRDMAVIAFTNEEGARFHPDMLGSYVWAGGMSVEAAHREVDSDGIGLGAELKRIGYEGAEKPGFLPAHAYICLLYTSRCV